MPNQPSSTIDIIGELDEFARDYQHNPIQHIILNPYKNSILTLRAKYATYEVITSTLNGKGVKVSEATVRKFCRTHQQEVKRLRSEFDRKRRETEGAIGSKTTSIDLGDKTPSSETKRDAVSSDTGRPGPKIARERL
jgi:hypothetical protein